MKSIHEILLESGLSDDRIAYVIAALPAPDARRSDTSPDYLRSLLEQSGLTQRELADLLDVQYRQVRYYFAGKREIPYTIQYALEMLAFLNTAEKVHKPQSEDSDD